MEFYAGLFLVVISIGYLTVRFARSRSVLSVKKGQKGSRGLVSSGSRGNPTRTTLRRSALIAGANQKPWGW